MNQNTKQKRSAASWLAELAKGRYGEYALSVLTAVSYTHPDVYKRQPQNESTATGTSEKHPILWNDIGIGIYTDKQLDPETFIVTQGPVSYTHLIYCRAYGLMERGKAILAETFYALYDEAGVFEDSPNWREFEMCIRDRSKY